MYPTEIYNLPIPPHYLNSSLPRFLPLFRPVVSCCLLPASLQQLTAAGYYWSALTSISAYRGMSHQNTHKKPQTQTQTPYAQVAQKHKLLIRCLLTSRCFSSDNHGYAPSLNDRNKTKGTGDKEREKLTHPQQAEQTTPPPSFFF